jgi:uncharacterized protein DUF4124
MTRLLLGLTCSLLLAAQAHAQTLYRCGNVYQDRPCDAGQKGKVLGSTGAAGSAGPATQTGGVDPECVQRGTDSNKIVWAREGGATEERLLSEAASESQRRLVRNAYRRPGAASSVQAAVEADCVAEKQREEQEAAIAVAAALKARREGGGAGLQPSPAQASADPKAQEQAAQQRAEYGADQKKRQCARYKDDMDRLRNLERAGGSASTMDSLNDQRRGLREQMSRAGC